MSNDSQIQNPLVRGRVVVSARSLIKETFGDHGWERLLEVMAPPHREILDGLILPDQWLERDIHVQLIENIHRLFASEVSDVLRRQGVRAATHQVRFYLKPLLRLGGPRMVMKRAAAVYRENFQGGEMALVESHENGGRMQLRDPFQPRLFCSEILPGYCEGIVRLGGRTPTRIAQGMCRFEGAPHCEIELEYT